MGHGAAPTTRSPTRRSAATWSREFVDAFRAEGIKIGFYHSLIDWHHPDFLDRRAPPAARRARCRAELNAGRDMARYREYLHGQVRELLTRYGEISYLFYDFSYPGHQQPEISAQGPRRLGQSDELMALTRELQPGIVINDRLDIPGDLVTPEQYQPAGARMTSGRRSWSPGRPARRSTAAGATTATTRCSSHPEMLVRMLVDGVSKGGNLLFNVGPTGRGTFDPGVRRDPGRPRATG